VVEDKVYIGKKLIGSLANEYNVPYIVDNAWGLPFIGTDLRKTNADVML
jgi:alanine-alpha-ketoisovalerate/valine-pyruvate aminotransferase